MKDIELKGGQIKMKKVNTIVVLLMGLFLIGTFSVAAFDKKTNQNMKVELNKINFDGIKNLDEASLRELIPETEVEILDMANENNVRWKRFILWSSDGKNVMWGNFGNGYFVAEDNAKGKSWGIYYKGHFAGFYEGGDFFYGKYRRNHWKAKGLFGLDDSRGKFLSFPKIKIPQIIVPSLE